MTTEVQGMIISDFQPFDTCDAVETYLTLISDLQSTFIECTVQRVGYTVS